MNGNESTTSTTLPPPSVSHGLSQLGSDVMTLMELQAELLKVDLREWFRSCVGALLLLAVALTVSLASLPVLMFSLAYTLNDVADISMPLALLIAGGAGLLIAVISTLVALRLMKRDASILSRSAAELRRNVRWLKAVLQSPTFAAEAK